MTRWTLLRIAAAGLLAGVAFPAPEGNPNILLILADDLGYGDVSAYGCTEFSTPHIDALAVSGMRFTAGYVTAPVCGPSRAALITGRHNARILPYFGNPPPGSEEGLPFDVPTLADHLKGAGYRTAALGKWHLGESPRHHPLSRGFDEFFGFLAGMHDYFKADDPRWGPILRGRERAELTRYLTFALADEACGFIQRAGTAPFFLYLSFNAPHTPMQAPDEYLAKASRIEDRMRRINAAMVMAMDDAIGRVMAALRDSGREAETLVVFLSDNGAALLPGSAPNGGSNAPLRGWKAELWEGGIRVPFIVRWPGRIAPGGTTGIPVSALDIVPTAMSAAGLPIRADLRLDGVDLLPWLAGQGEPPVRGPLVWKFGHSQHAIRDGDMKRICVNRDQGLFNVRLDMSETKDVSAARPALVRELDEAWTTWNSENPVIKEGRGPQRQEEK